MTRSSQPLVLVLLSSTLVAACSQPSADLVRVRDDRDASKMTHVRSRQTTRGLRIEGAELLEHVDDVGRTVAVESTLVPDAEAIDVQPAISASSARAKAAAIATGTISKIDDGELEVFAVRRAPSLAYRFTVRTTEPPALLRVTIDAKTGDVLESYDDLQRVAATGRSAAGVERSFEVSEAPVQPATWLMVDTTGASEIHTHTAEYGTAVPGALVASESLDGWDTAKVGAGAAVDAHANARVVIDYLKAVHDRAGLDGAGSAIVSSVHFAHGLDNAFYDPDARVLLYGDGSEIYHPLAGALDVVAHEMFHGVTQATSNLRYVGESGALNEAISDLFACFIEHRVSPDPDKNWTIGESVARAAGVGIRDLRNPAAHYQVAHESRYVVTQLDNGGVHINSGIPANAGYLMTVGGTNAVSRIRVPLGIGWERAEKLWYRASTLYFLSTTDFAEAASATLKAAEDLGYSQQERDVIACAWKAVGVMPGPCAVPSDPPPPPAPEAKTDGIPDRGELDANGPSADEEEVEVSARAVSPGSPSNDSEACQVAAPGRRRTSGGAGAALLLVASALFAARGRRRLAPQTE